MACFWMGIIKQLNKYKEKLPLLFQPVPKSPKELINFVKRNNQSEFNVTVMGKQMNKIQMKETRMWIDSLLDIGSNIIVF